MRKSVASVADQDVGAEPPQNPIVEAQHILVAVISGAGSSDRGAASERDRDSTDGQAVMRRHVGTEPLSVCCPGLTSDRLERDAEPGEPPLGVDLAAVLEE